MEWNEKNVIAMHLFVASILLLEKLSDVKTSYALFEIEMSLRSEI